MKGGNQSRYEAIKKQTEKKEKSSQIKKDCFSNWLDKRICNAIIQICI